MNQRIAALALLTSMALVVSCATSPERKGQRLFAGCADEVDDAATARSGLFVCKGNRDRAPFAARISGFIWA